MKSPLQAMRDLLEEDTRYKLEAYQFIRESLHFAQENRELLFISDTEDPSGSATHAASPTQAASAPKHVTGQQLCEACRQYALEQFGYLAKVVLANWGVKSTSDLGELVYNLIRIEQMRKSDTDRREDFNDVYSFEDAFEPQFELASDDSGSGSC